MALDDPSAFAPRDTPHNFTTEIDVPITSPALARLLDEVRGGDREVARGYNRTYNRHNR
jgi:hypothetical protein